MLRTVAGMTRKRTVAVALWVSAALLTSSAAFAFAGGLFSNGRADAVGSFHPRVTRYVPKHRSTPPAPTTTAVPPEEAAPAPGTAPPPETSSPYRTATTEYSAPAATAGTVAPAPTVAAETAPNTSPPTTARPKVERDDRADNNGRRSDD